MTNLAASLIQEDEALYHEKRKHYLTSHGLQTFIKSPALLKLERDRPEVQAETAEMAFGRAFHCLLLEGPQEFSKRYTVVDNVVDGKTLRKNSNAYKALVASGGGGPTVSARDYEQMLLMVSSVLSHESATDLLFDGVAEGVMRVTLQGAPCQIRVDWAGDSHFVDVKTCFDIDQFEQQIADYHYDQQLVFYRQVIERGLGFVPKGFLLAIEKAPAHRCGVWRLSETRVAEWQEINMAAIDYYVECCQSGIWPTGYEKMRVYYGT